MGSAGLVFVAMTTVRQWIAHDELFRSTDNGGSWMSVYQKDPTSGSRLFFHPSGVLFWGWLIGSISGINTGVLRSTDGGVTWTDCQIFGGWDFAQCGGKIFTLGNVNGSAPPGPICYIYCSSDTGSSWQLLWSNYSTADAILVKASGRMILSWWDGLYCSADTCKTWIKFSSIVPAHSINNGYSSPHRTMVSLPSGGILVGTDTMGIFLFSDNGDSLGTLNTGLTDLHIHCLAIDTSGYVYAGTNAGVWRRALSEIVAVHERAPNVPEGFSLYQNYPNPFNPTTTIEFSIPASPAGGPKSSIVNLKIFDLLGRAVATLVDEKKDAGVYEVKFNASKLSSGVYFYQLQAGSFVQTKKLILLR